MTFDAPWRAQNSNAPRRLRSSMIFHGSLGF
jgi:hypothetical protein